MLPAAIFDFVFVDCCLKRAVVNLPLFHLTMLTVAQIKVAILLSSTSAAQQKTHWFLISAFFKDEKVSLTKT